MDWSFPTPITTGEWLSFAVASLTALLGLCHLFAPRLMLRASGLALPPEKESALAHLRGPEAGFLLGLGLGALLLAQPLIYLVLGFAWAFAAFGRVIGMLSDGAGGRNLAFFVFELVLAVAGLVFPLGLVA